LSLDKLTQNILVRVAAAIDQDLASNQTKDGNDDAPLKIQTRDPNTERKNNGQSKTSLSLNDFYGLR
jgi:hypothetical protein